MTVQIDPRQFGDPRWRLYNAGYRITDKRGKEVLFRPNAAQERFLDELHSRNIVLKARQLGFTTLCCLIYLDACLFGANVHAGVIAHRLDDAKAIFKDRVKFPADHIPEQLRERISTVQDSTDTLSFKNGSSIRVSISMRSGTLQYLHVSEFGKLCAQYPERAREVVTGSLNTVAAGEFVVIESTAEGQEGRFYEMVQEARRLQDSGAPLTDLDYKFHFHPWYEDRSYTLPGAFVGVDLEMQRYFDRLEADGVTLTDGQKAWYIKTEATQEADMRREYPSSPEEAFEQALEGAYFSTQLAIANKQGRIGGFPYDPRYRVNSFWDLGRNDNTSIWLHQHIGGYHRFVGYYENSGEFIGHYVKWLQAWADERDAIYGDHYLPHDGKRESLWLEGGTLGVMNNLGFRPSIVQRSPDKLEDITVARAIMARCQWDETACALGLTRLRAYRKEWDDLRGVWKDRPRHDEASHGADAFMTFASSGVSEGEQLAKTPNLDRHRRALYGRARVSGHMTA